MSLSNTQSSRRFTRQSNHRGRKVAAGLFVLQSLSQFAPSGHAQEAPAGNVKPGGVIRYGHFQEPPCLFGGWVQQWYLQRQYSDNLVARSEDGKFVPWLAESWTISDDKKVYTFEIKPNVKFTDGTPLDAQAVADNITGWLSNDPDLRNPTAAPYLSDSFESARAIAPLRLQVILKVPFQPLLNVLAQSSQGILSPSALKRGLAVNCENPVGSGPFIVDKWRHGREVTFRRNPDYNSAPATAKHQGPAYVDGISWKFLPDQTVRYGSLITGETDAIYDIPAIAWKDANSRFAVLRHLTGGTPLRLALYTARPPFDDVLVRKALAYSTDRKAAVDTSFLGSLPFEGNGALSQSSPEYLHELGRSYAYDIRKANQLLDQAGWTERNSNGVRIKNGNPLIVRISYSNAFLKPDGEQALQVIQQQARAAGFDVRLQPTNPADFFAGKNLGPDDYEVVLLYWVAPGAEIFRISWKPDQNGESNRFNPSRYQDLMLWDVIQKAEQDFNGADRTALYQQAERKIVDDAPVIGLTVLDVTLAIKPNLKDVWLDRGSVGEPVFYDAHFDDKK
ncbi:peptide/nickel transport system substrate-binding protein [Bradyrhizobium sp. Ghvi]|uniref:ABC transporter substrate-binding protein n=1 Tax=Bradyrhizobium sp. Ghvi TaxID=1855319 RepID=UPI0008F3B1CB|nr:ABC transporter substrate-binding protein [Bradyrhizobium sp. Ghvi]SFQ07971.1 peptide/nickel transport system substrate-binding protein [Bradyrhizobium sp. Ghvi]